MRRVPWEDILRVKRVKAGIRITAKGIERTPIIFLIRPLLMLPLKSEEVLDVLEEAGAPVDRTMHPTGWFTLPRSGR